MRYDVDERIAGGSMSPRLNPRIAHDRLNTRLGPTRPRPLVRETSGSGCLYENGGSRRKGLIGLPGRLKGG